MNKAVTAVKGLSFFRTRSTPPQSRDRGEMDKVPANDAPPTIVNQPAPTLDNNANLPPPAASSEKARSLDPNIVPPTVVVTPDETPNSSVPINTADPNSPALAAILLDRKRRLAAAGSGPSARPRPGLKGKFKSTRIDTLGASKIAGTESTPPSPAPGVDTEDDKVKNSEVKVDEDD